MEKPRKAGFAPLLATRASARGQTVSLPSLFAVLHAAIHAILTHRSERIQLKATKDTFSPR
jgi:hypothetical protein